MSRWPEHPALVSTVGLLGIAGIGVLDYVTGYDIRLLPLYFLPIAFVAWRLPHWAVLGFAVVGAAMWLGSNWLAGRGYSPLILLINFASQFIAFTVVGYLVAELRRRLVHEQQLSRQDPLTGLPNTRAFYEQGERLIALARRSRRPVTLAYLDLDDFKTVNDERGHREGDRALTQTAAALERQLRESDFAARLGGDEFAILLPDTDAEAARALLQRLHADVAARMRQNSWPISSSIGAVCYTQAPPRLADAVHDADSLMYRAKDNGKNQVLLMAVGLDGGDWSSAVPQLPVGEREALERPGRRASR